MVALHLRNYIVMRRWVWCWQGFAVALHLRICNCFATSKLVGFEEGAYGEVFEEVIEFVWVVAVHDYHVDAG